MKRASPGERDLCNVCSVTGEKDGALIRPREPPAKERSEELRQVTDCEVFPRVINSRWHLLSLSLTQSVAVTQTSYKRQKHSEPQVTF